MWAEGWNKKSIADCLKLSRKHVHEIIDAFVDDGFAGLEDKRTRPINHPENQLALPLFKEILDIQREYPRAGRFRVLGLLEQQFDNPPSERTVGRAMAINREFHGAPGPWRTNKVEKPPDATQNTSSIALNTATNSGSLIFATWSNSMITGSTVSV